MRKRRPLKRTIDVPAGVVVGVAWYDVDEWAKLKQVAADPEFLEETYEEWQHHSERAIQDLHKAGIVASRVAVGVDELVRWCQSQNRPIDGAARADYAAEQLRQLHQGPPDA